MSATAMLDLKQGDVEYLPITLKEERVEEFDENSIGEQLYGVDILTLCRVCGKHGPNTSMIGIFSPSGKQLQIQVKLNQHLSVNVQKNDVLPLQLCKECIVTLESFHKMYKLSIEVNTRLHKYFTKTIENHGYCSSTNYVPPDTPQTTTIAEKESTDPLSENEDSQETPIDRSDLQYVISYHCDEDLTAHDTASSTVNTAGKKLQRLATLFCSLCNATLKGAYQLQKHCVTDHNKYKCTRCDELFDTEEDKKQHQGTAHLFTCWCCGLITSNEKLLIAHFKDVHPEEKPFKCSTCGCCCKTERFFISHLETHGEVRKYICDTCGEGFKTAVVLGHHKKSHLHQSERRPHLCSDCGQTFYHLSKLKCHMRIHTGEKPFHCSKCSKTFRSKTYLKLHESVHSSDRKYACELCGVSYKHSRNLDGHKLMKHSGGFDFKCALCPNTYKSEGEVLEHVQIHSETEKTAISGGKLFMKVSNYQCNVCRKFFMNKQSLAHHIKKVHGPNAAIRVHDDETAIVDPPDDLDLRRGLKQYYPRNFTDEGKEFVCDQCGKRLATKFSLSTHKRMHLKERPYVCNICNSGFTLRCLLKDHMRVHTGEMPFKCDACDKKFHRSSNLNLHKKRVHLNLRPHKCRFCEKTFKDHSSRTVHERIHTGVKPYVCDICNKSFTQKPELNQHRKRNTCSQPTQAK